MVNGIESTRPILVIKPNKQQASATIDRQHRSETQQKQTKSILPAQLTEQANFTPIAEQATDN